MGNAGSACLGPAYGVAQAIRDRLTQNTNQSPSLAGKRVGVNWVGCWVAWGGMMPEIQIAIEALSDVWKSHSMDRQAEGKGRRLVDVFLEMGDAAREDKEFEEALGYYKKALSI